MFCYWRFRCPYTRTTFSSPCIKRVSNSINNLRIRIAQESDVDALVQFGRRAYSNQFGNLYPPKTLESFFERFYSHEVFHYWVGSKEFKIWITESDSDLCGYLLVGPCTLPHTKASQTDYEIKRLYVHEDLFGKGAAGILMSTCLDWIMSEMENKESNTRKESIKVWVGCYSENHRALQFYNKYQFKTIGEYFFSVEDSRDLDYIMCKEIIFESN